MQADMNIGMLGHVDHGKTTLTQALTGKWTDTHSEEIKRGISIRLGYADCAMYKCDKCSGLLPCSAADQKKCSKCSGKLAFHRKISIVDAPGHETLMTTVIAATSILDGVLFLIAANEPCPQPQTAEHLLVLKSTGIKNIIIVQTKIDLVSKEKALENYLQIKQLVKDSPASDAPIIPISANYNLNIDKLLEAIDKKMIPSKNDENAQLRMFISRSFDVNRPGVAVTELRGGVLGGSVVQGSIKLGEEIEIKPGIVRKDGAKPTSIACCIQSLMEETESLSIARPGGLVAVGTTLDPALTKADLLVGSIIGRKGEVPDPINILKIKYQILYRSDIDNPSLKENEVVVVNAHTATTVGVITNISKSIATIRLKKPLVVYNNMNVALSRKFGQRWRLSAWGCIV